MADEEETKKRRREIDLAELTDKVEKTLKNVKLNDESQWLEFSPNQLQIILEKVHLKDPVPVPAPVQGLESEEMQIGTDKNIIDEHPSEMSLIRTLINQYSKEKIAIQNIDFTSPSIAIDPKLLSPNCLQDRFDLRTQNEALFFIKTKLYEDIKAEFTKIEERPFGSENHQKVSFFYGEVGIGKSFSLSLNIIERRRNWSQCPYLIYYINNPIDATYTTVFREFVYSLCFTTLTDRQASSLSLELKKEFQLDTTTSIEEQCQDLWEKCWADSLNTNAKGFRFLMRLLFKVKKHVLIVLDQVSINEHQKFKSMYKICLDLITNPPENVSLFFFSSRLPPLEWTRVGTSKRYISKLSGKFTEVEAKLFLENNLKKTTWNTKDLNTLDFDKIEGLIALSENIPFELSILCQLSYKSANQSEDQLLSDYIKTRQLELKEMHSQVSKSLERGKWIEFLALTFLNIPFQANLDDDETDIDLNLCYFSKSEFEDLVPSQDYYQLKFYSPLYREWVMQEKMALIAIYIKNMKKPVILEKYSNNFKLKPASQGDFMEKYCILRLCFFASHTHIKAWSFHSYDTNFVKKDSSTTFKLLDYSIFRVLSHTIGDRLLEYFENPHADDRDGGSNEATSTYCGKLFIPDAENFEGIDMIFFSAKSKKIFLLQYAKNIMKHKASDVIFDQKLNAVLIPSNKSSFWSLIKGIRTLRDKGCTTQYIWIGLTNGVFGNQLLTENNFQAYKEKEMVPKHKDSLIVLLDENSEFKEVQSIL